MTVLTELPTEPGKVTVTVTELRGGAGHITTGVYVTAKKKLISLLMACTPRDEVVSSRPYAATLPAYITDRV